jgi:hypothetical protein
MPLMLLEALYYSGKGIHEFLPVYGMAVHLINIICCSGGFI